MRLAALQLANDSELETYDALIGDGYKEGEINQKKRKAVMRQKLRFIDELNAKKKQRCSHNYYVIRKEKSIAGESNNTSISSVTNPLQQDEAIITSTLASNKSWQGQSNTSKKTKPADKRQKLLAAKSRLTRKQVLAYMAEKNEVEKKRQAAYTWAVQQVNENVETNAAKVAREASLKFDSDVKADTVWKLLRNNRVTTSRSGPKGKFTDAELEALEVAILSYLALSQANCSAEKNEII